MATEFRYTDEHARAGLDFDFPAIETWENQFPGYEIVIDDPELTSVCPKTGLPDFGSLTIRYMPRSRCLELKSLKEYLFSYRNLGIFQENIVNQVLEDVVKACDPVWAVVRGEFRPRGGRGQTCSKCHGSAVIFIGQESASSPNLLAFLLAHSPRALHSRPGDVSVVARTEPAQLHRPLHPAG